MNLHHYGMKTIIFILLFLLLGWNVGNATHITGGEITYTYTSGDVYLITLKIYRDCGPDNTNSTGFDDPAHIGIYEDNLWYDTADAQLFSATVSEVPANISNPCLITPPQVCIEECIYTAEIFLPQNTTGYDLVYVRCCRSPAIINLVSPQSQGMTCNTHIPGTTETTGTNNSAVFTNLPPTLLCTNEFFSMDHSAIDPDGDSLSYEFCWPLLGADDIEPYPNPTPTYNPVNVVWQNPYTTYNPIAGAPAFEIDPETGWFTGTPNTSGKWVYAICVSEFRNGALINVVKRDYMVQILMCEQVVTAAITSPEPCQGLTISFDNNSINANAYAWDFGVENVVSDTSFSIAPEFTYPDTGMYVLTLIAQPGAPCADTLVTQLYVNELLQADVILETSECFNGAMHFDYMMAGNYSNEAEIFWDYPNGANPSSSSQENPTAFQISAVGNNLPVVITLDDHGCELSITEFITVPQMPQVNIIPPADPCVGLTISIDANISGATIQTWDFGVPGMFDVSNEEDPTYTFSNYGTYNVVLTAENEAGCTDSDELPWAVFDPNPLVMSYEIHEPFPCTGDSSVLFIFTGSGATSITWITGDGTIAEGNTFAYMYDDQGQYSAQLIIENALCDAMEMANMDVTYDIHVPMLDIEMPNVITPNADSKNSYFRPFEPNEQMDFAVGTDIFNYIDQYVLQVYDRWGTLIFENNGNESWDGTFDSTPVSEGVYYYIVKYHEICTGKSVDKAGHVTVMK